MTFTEQQEINPIIKDKILNDEDFILSKKYGNSLSELQENEPNGVTDKMAANMLGITLSQFEATYNNIVLKLQNKLK